MYCGYDINFLQKEDYDDTDDFYRRYYNYGLSIFNRQKNDVITDLNKFALSEDALNGSSIQANWFPQIKSDIFLSHSHSDEEIAITIAGFLGKELNLNVFIDSCLWGYSNNLLRIIDDMYCQNLYNDTYNYSKRNFSTSHVHMMLSTALTMMIDNSECIFFLNTPNSLNTKDIIQQTMSPWIYSEITISRLIRKKKPTRLIELKESLEKALTEEDFSFNYTVDISHFRKLYLEEFQSWVEKAKKDKNVHPLNILYDVASPIKSDRYLV